MGRRHLYKGIKKTTEPLFGKVPRTTVFTLLTLSLLVAGCTERYREATAPLNAAYYKVSDSSECPTLFVFLPGRRSMPADFERNGFIDALRSRGIQCDAVAVDLHMGYYMNKSIFTRLKDDVIGPARQKGYKTIWLVGISLGGLGAVIYAAEYPEDIQGVLLIAPYLGEEEILHEIGEAGGLSKWKPGHTAEEDWQRRLWSYLKKVATDHTANPVIYLSYGLSDRYASGARLLGNFLPPSHVHAVEGHHDWSTWIELWDAFLTRWPAISVPATAESE